MNIRSKAKGFTPLEKAVDFNRLSYPIKADRGIKPSSAQNIRKLRSLTGFTLIETVISLGILLIGILAVLALFPVGFDSAARSADVTKAAIFAQDRMEEIKRAGFQNPIPADAIGTFLEGGQPSKFNFLVHYQDVNPPGNLQRVTLTVSWTYKGRLYNEIFVTFIPQLGP